MRLTENFSILISTIQPGIFLMFPTIQNLISLHLPSQGVGLGCKWEIGFTGGIERQSGAIASCTVNRKWHSCSVKNFPQMILSKRQKTKKKTFFFVFNPALSIWPWRLFSPYSICPRALSELFLPLPRCRNKTFRTRVGLHSSKLQSFFLEKDIQNSSWTRWMELVSRENSIAFWEFLSLWKCYAGKLRISKNCQKYSWIQLFN